MHILTPVSPGELVDKITILEIKLSEIKDETKLVNVRNEFDLLMKTLKESVEITEEIQKLKEALRVVNKSIWDSENDVREFWNDDAKFLEGARNSHYGNDERAKLKRALNDLLGSSIIEEKSHPTYEHK